MNIGFLTDVDGYRAPIHPESFEKYSMDLHLEKIYLITLIIQILNKKM